MTTMKENKKKTYFFACWIWVCVVEHFTNRFFSLFVKLSPILYVFLAIVKTKNILGVVYLRSGNVCWQSWSLVSSIVLYALLKLLLLTMPIPKIFWGLSTCGLVMYAGNHDLLCQVGNLNAKNGIESLLNSITSPPATACWPNKKAISQMTNWTSWGKKTFVVGFSGCAL